MIRQLRIKFIAITMAVLVIVFAIVFATLNIFMQTSSLRQTQYLLQTVVENDGLFFPHDGNQPPWEEAPPPPFAPEPALMRAGRFFYVKLDHNDSGIETNFEMMFDFTETEALEFAHAALSRGQESGTIDSLQYLVAEKGYGKIIVFAERSIETRMLTQLIQLSLWIAGGTFVVLFLFSLFLSNWVVKPVSAAFIKQRRFISDAGHELKTPLTIIAANVDVLESEIGSNTRLANIKAQSNRMNLLIRDLLILAKADETAADVVMNEFELSKAIKKTTLEFESLAFEERKSLYYDIEDDIRFIGNEPQIKQLLAILIDNAIKHSKERGEVKVTLRKNREKIRLSVYNSGPGIAENERDKVFDRFYRSDDSRSRETGGYGLGLSIAKSIVSAHKGKIEIAGRTEEWIEVIVIL